MGILKDASPILKRSENPSGFGLRWQAERDTALGEWQTSGRVILCESAVAAALCRRSPKRQRITGDVQHPGRRSDFIFPPMTRWNSIRDNFPSNAAFL
jgi:hypothetical protein